MNALWVFSEIVDTAAAVLFFALGLSGSLYAYGLTGPGPFRRFHWRAERRRVLRWLAPLLVLLSLGSLFFHVRDLRTSSVSANKPVQATAAAPFVFSGLGDSLLPPFVVAQVTAAVPDLCR